MDSDSDRFAANAAGVVYGLLVLAFVFFGGIELVNGAGYLMGFGPEVTVRVEGVREVETETGKGWQPYGYYDLGGELREVAVSEAYRPGDTVEVRVALVTFGAYALLDQPVLESAAGAWFRLGLGAVGIGVGLCGGWWMVSGMVRGDW